MSGTMGRTWGLVWRREFLAGSVESGAEDPVGILKTKSPEAKNYQRNMN